MGNMHDEAVRLTREKVTIHEMINFDKKPENPVKVSIVVPVCNVEQYLRECIDSCVNQTLRDIEIICVNDGSTDSCPEILREYAEKDERVKVVNKDNAGYGQTMNLGMDLAQGEYIGIVESDDFVVPEMYEELYNAAKANDVDLVKADFYRFYGTKGNYNSEYNKTARDDENYNVVIDPSENVECFRYIMNTWSGIYDRSFLTEHNIRHNETPGASFQDNGFWFKTFAESHKIMFVDKPYYMNRRDNPNSSVYNPNKVYCGNDEYKYIRVYLRSNPGLEDKFLFIFSQKRFHTYMFTLNRIAPVFKKAYLHNFSEDFKKAADNGELDQAYFTKKEWETLHWIMRDPDEYYYNCYLRRIKVSVVLPVYNVEKYLEQCLDSLIAQTLKDFEVICIDDGSTDNSYSILYDYSMRDKRIKVYHQENSGAGAARNFGIELAQGEYIIFLDSDDYFDENMLKESYNKAVLTNSDICIFKSKQYDEKTGEISDCNFSVKSQYLPQKETFSISEVTGNPFTSIMGWVWDKLYKKSFVINNGLLFQEQRTTNDMYFAYASLMKAGKITVLDKRLYFQRRNVPTSLSNTRALSWECFYFALLKVREDLRIMGIYDEYKQDFVNYALHSCLWNFNSLPQKQSHLLFTRLREEWFETLEIRDYGEDFYQNAEEYRQYLDIINAVPDGWGTDGFWSYMMNRLRSENDILKDPTKTYKVKENEFLTMPEIIEKLQWNREQRAILLSKLEGKGYIYADDPYEELKNINQEIINIRNSFSFKVGRFITWLPRKLRGLFKK